MKKYVIAFLLGVAMTLQTTNANPLCKTDPKSANPMHKAASCNPMHHAFCNPLHHAFATLRGLIFGQ